MANVKVKVVRACLIDGEHCPKDKVCTVDEKTGAYLMRIGRAVPAGAQTKKTTTKDDSDK